MPQTIEKIGQQSPDTGRFLKEDSTTFNIADAISGAMDKSGSIKTVGELQNAVHDGLAYGFSSHASIAGLGILIFLGRVGAKQVHFDGLSCDVSQGPFLIELFEAPTVTTTGTAQATRRRNRANATVSTMLVYSGATVSANGLLVDDDLVQGIGLGSNTLSGTAGVDAAFVLKANTDYIIKFTNQAATATTYNAKFIWHEATYNV
jgi:hypothetical protein